jgi:hypothetical protein
LGGDDAEKEEVRIDDGGTNEEGRDEEYEFRK